jgi:glycosyltransferase involved in cell wall biosynthesis
VTVHYFADTRFPIERANGLQTMATCRALAGRGHDVTLVVRPDTASDPRDPFAFYDESPAPRLTFRTIPAAGSARSRRMRYLVESAVIATRASGVIYTRDIGLAAFLLRLPLSRRIRLIYESHGVSDVVAAEMHALLGRPASRAPADKLRRLARREARVWRKARAYVALTHVLAKELETRFGPRAHVFVVPDGARRGSEPVPRPTDGAGMPIVGYAGHLYPWKGVDVLIRALAALPTARAIIVGGHPGETDLARVEAMATTLGVRDRVTFTGLVAPARVAEALAPATILALPNTASAISERYTSPLKLFEYLAFARPIVASDLPALREVLTDQETALLVPSGDDVALAKAVERLAADRALSDRLAANAWAASAEYTWEKRAERLEAVLEAAVA